MNEHVEAAVAARNRWFSGLQEYFWPKGPARGIWAVVDAARDSRILPVLEGSQLEHRCLYRGPIPRVLAAAAPYLVQLDYQDPGTRQFLEEAWGNSWGIFLRCGRDPYALRRHLRQFLVVRDISDRRLVFRYYDPRVLRVFLPTCTEPELEAIFGPIDCFWTEDEQPDTALEFSFDHLQLIERRLAVIPASTAALPGSRHRDEESKI